MNKTFTLPMMLPIPLTFLREEACMKCKEVDYAVLRNTIGVK